MAPAEITLAADPGVDLVEPLAGITTPAPVAAAGRGARLCGDVAAVGDIGAVARV